MVGTITNYVSQGLVNIANSSYSFIWYKCNFNMPVPNVFYDPGYYTRYLGTATPISESTSYNLAGFVPGYEICVGTTNWDWENDSGTPYNLNTYIYSRWTDPSVTTTISQGIWGYNVVGTLPAYTYASVWSAVNVGCAGWEINSNDTYHFRSNATGTPAIAVVDTSVTFSNVPSTTQLSSDKAGYIWVEGNNLCYICANRWKHTIVGDDLGNVSGTPGYFWLDDIYGISWIGSDGNHYTTTWSKKQFRSSFQPSATGEVYAGTSNAGKIWVDSEFGLTHLAYIGTDGYKYLTGAGDNPYR